MGGYGHRNMYYMTGLPGWMRIGYGPGRIGRSSSGLGPPAQSPAAGQGPTPRMQAERSGVPSGAAHFPFSGQASPPFSGQASPDQELTFLKNQALALAEQVQHIGDRIAELKKTGS